MSALSCISLLRIRLVSADKPNSKEEAYLSRPEVRIPTTDHIKCILVDDWEHITRNMLLVSLPSKMPFNRILGDYHDSEKLKRAPGSADLDILDEAMAGLKEYFSAGLGRVLLYAIEREQYAQLRQQWEANGQGPGDVYGGEHLLRLIGTPSCYPCSHGLANKLQDGPPKLILD